MTVRLVMVQPSPSPDQHDPVPLYVSETGEVAQQDFWQGHPREVAGFTDRFDREQITLTFDQFWADPAAAVGKYLVLVDVDDRFSTALAAVAETKVVVDTSLASAAGRGRGAPGTSSHT